MPPRPHMRDACQIGIYDTDTAGPEPGETWTYGSAIRCRFLRVSTRDVTDGNEHHLSDVQIHVPAGTTVSTSSRIKLTERNNTTLGTAEYFEVLGEPWNTEDNRVIVLNCQSVPVGAE